MLPFGHGAVGDLDVILQPVSRRAKPERLHRASIIARQHFAAGRQRRDFGPMPLEGLQRAGKTGEQRIGCAGRGQLDFARTNLRSLAETDFAAERSRKQLMPEADPEIWPAKLLHEASDRSLLRHQPGMLVFLPNVLRAAHHDQSVVRL